MTTVAWVKESEGKEVPIEQSKCTYFQNLCQVRRASCDWLPSFRDDGETRKALLKVASSDSPSPQKFIHLSVADHTTTCNVIPALSIAKTLLLFIFVTTETALVNVLLLPRITQPEN